jgi:protein-L-isoaspartate(D-aspartate) O-methyltransferase
VLEIGTGSAYQTALLAELAAQVFSIERFPALLDKARPLLQQANVRNVSLLLGDGTLGWREYGPYDGIVVSAGAPHVPPALEEQLAEGGRMLIPGQLEGRDIVPVRFVPLIGAGGWLA